MTRAPGRVTLGVAVGTIALGASILSGCGGSDDGDDPAGAGEVVVDGIAVRGAWTRATPPNVSEAAIYLEIENLDAPADRLLGGRAEPCLSVPPHATEIDENDVATMRELGPDDLSLEPGATLDFSPNGLHLMCVGLTDPIEAGDELTVELVFERHATIPVPVEVLPL